MKVHHILLTFILIFAFFSQTAFGVVLLDKEEALKEMFPEADEIVEEVHELTEVEITAVKDQLGGQLVHFQRGSQSEMVQDKLSYTFYFGMIDGEKMGVAIIEEQPGKWGPVEFIIALDNATVKVKNLAVMSYQEKRGRPIARKSFLNQFIGKGSEDPIKVRKDVRAISGATISSDATCFAVKKVIALYEEVYIKKQLTIVE